MASALKARDYKDVTDLVLTPVDDSLSLEQRVCSMTVGSSMMVSTEIAPPLRGRDYKDPSIVFIKR